VELDINPLIADEQGAVALDARIVVQGSHAGEIRNKTTVFRYAHMAIHPYPAELASDIDLADGARLHVRPIRPEDSAMEAQFVKDLSESSRHFRFMNTMRELSSDMLARFTQIDYGRDMAFVVIVEGPPETQVAVARYAANPDGRSCEFAIVIADAWQCRGLGRKLMTLLIDAARARGLNVMEGYVLSSNRAMLGLCEKLGFVAADDPGDPMVRKVALVL
jgi:acetyltransferase